MQIILIFKCKIYQIIIVIKIVSIFGMNRSSTSPFRSSVARGSANYNSESLQLTIRSLQRENQSLVSQINNLRRQARRVIELQERIQSIARQNNQFISQNEKLSRMVTQKKSQIEIWKNKFQSLSSNKNSSSELQIRRLLNQIQKIKEQSTEIQHIKNVQLNQLKHNHSLQIQNFKRNSLSTNQKYELEIRKLKQYCERKQGELSDLNMKLVRVRKQADFEINKLQQQKERLRADLQTEQRQYRREVQSLKSKFDYNFHSEIQNLKKQHLNQVETLDYENSKLKEVINSKNIQIQGILAKHSKVKNNYQDSIDILKRQNDQLKSKMVENQHISDLQLNNLRDKLDGIKESQLALLKDSHANQCQLLNREINKLRTFLDNSNLQLENLTKQKNQVRSVLEASLSKAQAELEAQISDNQVAEAQHRQHVTAKQRQISQLLTQLKTMKEMLSSQIETLKLEKSTINSELQSKQQQLERERATFRAEQMSLKEDLSKIREQLTSSKQESQRNSKKSSSDLEDAKKIFELKIKQLQTQISSLQEENKQKDSLIEQLRSNIQNLQKEILVTNQQVSLLQNTENSLRRQMRQNFSKWDAKEKELNRLIRQQIEGMTRTKTTQIQQLKSIQDNKIRSLKHQIKQLQRVVEEKNRLINNMKKDYEELVNKFEAIFAQEAARKNLDIKVPGWLPETLSTKYLFDVFLKNKVLQYCS